MRNLISLGLVLLTTGCVVYTSDNDTDDVYYEEAVNYTPTVLDAEAGCYFDSYYYDDIWYFEADIDDANSPYDVVAVYADVYDSYSGTWVDSFELFPTNDAYYWFSDWLGSSTYLDCMYGGYVVDILPPLENVPSDDPAADTARYIAVLEEQIRKCPEQYYWVHKRFKKRPEPLPDAYADLDSLK